MILFVMSEYANTEVEKCKICFC